MAQEWYNIYMDPNLVQQPQQGAFQAAPQPNSEPTQQDLLMANSQALTKKKQAAQNDPNNPFSPAQISQVMAQVAPKSPAGKVGKAIATPAYAGFCLRWVDDQQKTQNRQPNAFADYLNNAKAGYVKNTDKAPAGARVYFAPDASNEGMGHVGISNGDGSFTSATDNGIKTFGLKDWEKYTGQKFIGWSPSKN